MAFPPGSSNPPGVKIDMLDGPRGPRGMPGEQGPPGDPAELLEVLEQGEALTVDSDGNPASLGPVVSRDEYEAEVAQTTQLALLRQSSQFVRGMAFAPAMDEPPEITETSGSSSSIASAVLVSQADARFRYESLISAEENGFRYHRKTYGSGSGAALLAWRVSFGFDGDECELKLNAPTTSARYRVWVDGKPAAATMTAAAATGDRRVLVDLATRAPRNITVELDGGVYFGGVWRGPTATVSAPLGGSPVRFSVLGDSYVYGTGAVSSRVGGFAHSLGRLLGWPLTTTVAAGGTGYVTANSPEGNYLTRFPDVIDSAPDVLLVTGSQNDQTPVSSSPGSVTAAATTLIGMVRDQLPDTRLVMSGLLFAGTPSAPQLAIDAEIKAAATALGVPWIETQSPAWFYGTGTSGSTTSNGNADYYRGGSTGTDGAHPTQAGHDHLARRFAAALPAALGL